MTKRLAVFLMALSQVVLLGIVLARYPAHLSDPLWPAHAKAHLVSQTAALTGLAGISLLLLFMPFRVASRWRSAYGTSAALSATYCLGLASGWRHRFGPGA